MIWPYSKTKKQKTKLYLIKWYPKKIIDQIKLKKKFMKGCTKITLANINKKW
jgi:hypothetical protein